MSDPDVNPIARRLSNQPRPTGDRRNLRRRRQSQLPKWLAIFAMLLLLGGVATFGIVMAYIKPLREQAATFDLEALHKIEKASLILDRRGAEVGRIYMLNRTPISINQVPQNTIDALVAQEDERFFQHNGVDFIGIVRAIWLNYRAGSETQGASTITQQLAREAFKLKELEKGDKNSRYNRKIVEWFLAERIEQNYTKSEILELYLNRIYFGGGFYGIQAAAQGFFGKNASQLTVTESATIAGIIKSPNNLQPLRHPQRAANARNHVLNRMVIEGTLSPQERDTLSAQPVVTVKRATNPQDSYVYEAVRQEAARIIGGEAALLGGFNIHTTIDSKLQKVAEASVRKHLAEVETRQGYAHQTYEKYRALVQLYEEKSKASKSSAQPALPKPEYLQAAVLAIDNEDGGILAMVGGRDFSDSEYNRALQTSRPAGTAFTPFVFATAFQSSEYFPPLQIEDRPIDNRRVMIGGLQGILGEWGTETMERTVFKGTVTAREALAQGRNSATAELGERLGRGPVIELAKKVGFQSTIKDYPSSFLGASEVRLDELCLAYSTFANRGKRPQQVTLIKRITDYEGKIIYEVKEDTQTQIEAIDEIAAYQTHSCLTDALAQGTGKLAYTDYGLEEFPAAGKTGTHYEFKDLWFLGYSSAITCGVWSGFDQQKTIYEGAFSNRITLPIWVDIMNASRKDYKPEEFAPPESAELVEVCRTSGQRATDGCYINITKNGTTQSVRNTTLEVLRPDSHFDSFCTQHPHSGLDLTPPRLRGPLAQNTPSYSGIEHASATPVRMQGATLIGNDPYKTVLPVVKAEPVNPDGSRVIKAEPVEEPEATQSPIKLAPPPKLELE
jgi:membrane carboxypeptidase/penicillin-binding protein